MGACRLDSRGCTMLVPSSDLAARLFAFQTSSTNGPLWVSEVTAWIIGEVAVERLDAGRQSVESSPGCDRSAGVGCSVACSS